MSLPQESLFATPAPASLHRLFFALLPDDQERERLAGIAASLRPAFPGARWVHPRRYHLTLHYLGESEGGREAHIQAALAAAGAIAAAVPFAITLDQLRALGNPRTPALTLAAGSAPAAMEPFWRTLQAVLIRAGFKQHLGQSFVPHLTLAYAKPDPATGPAGPVVLRPRAFHLIQSVQGQADYQILASWPLAQ